MGASQTFSIIIPSWNNLPFLRQCIRSIRQNSRNAHQIIVHVNEGSDGTADYLRAEGIAFTQSAENIGICHAFNSALTRAGCDLVMYMNDDMYVLPEWDEELLRLKPDHDRWMLSATMIEARAGH